MDMYPVRYVGESARRHQMDVSKPSQFETKSGVFGLGHLFMRFRTEGVHADAPKLGVFGSLKVRQQDWPAAALTVRVLEPIELQ